MIVDFDFYEPDCDDLLLEIELGERAAYAVGAWHDWQNPRLCESCQQAVWPDRPDPCLGWLPGVEFACCGHGARGGFPQGYIAFTNGRVVRFDTAMVDGVHVVTEVDEDGAKAMRVAL